MSEVNAVDPARLRDIVEAFATLTWPAEKERMAEIAPALGWTVESESGRGMDFQTGYAISSPRAEVLLADGWIAQVNVDVTDRIRNADAGQVKEFEATARRLRDEISTALGGPVREKSGKDARYTWDLDNRGRVAVAKLNRVVQLIVLQERYADIERGEERHGISDDHDPNADLD
jgi:hypothetical protein